MELRTTGSVFVVFLCSVAVVLGQDWGVTYTLQRVCVLRGSSVDLSCSYIYPSGTVNRTFWFTKSDTVDLSLDPEYAGRVQYCGDNKSKATLKITDLRERDAAEYKFRFITDQPEGRYTGKPGVTLSVTGLQVEVTPSTYIGQSVTLTCSSTCPLTGNPSYIWYKNGQHVQQASRQWLSVSSNSQDSYSCAVEGHEDLRSPAVCVSGQNCWSVNYPTRRVCVLRGSSVNISSTYTHPNDYKITNTFWFKGVTSSDLKDDSGYTHRVEYTDSEVKHHILRIKGLRETDSAEYKFRMITDGGGYEGSPGVQLTVTGLQVEVTPSTVTEGQNVTLTCNSTCPLTGNSSYIWYKNNQTRPETQQKLLYLGPVSSEDAGIYSCAVTEHQHLRSPEETLNVTYKPRNISVSVSPSGEVVEGSSVTLTCSSDANPPVQTYTWYQENITSSKSSGQSYTITNISSEDSGGYYCQAGNTVGATNSSVVMITLIIRTGISTAQAAAAGTTVSVLLAVILLSACLLCRRKKASKPSTDPRPSVDNGQGDSGPVYDNVSATTLNPVPAVQTHTHTDTHTDTNTDTHTNTDTGQQDDVHYASVDFSRSKTQDVPLYSTIQSVQPQNQEEDVQYAAVQFNRPSPAPRVAGQTTEDPSALYSTVTKPKR
ncbi:B-cell receptor CD22-like [Osmerus mordax]|uniref:B-cell receptor CD22-like n=1 Tax=Osmerus mordax TaxID=8014 RepID=UPI00350F591E